METLLNSVGEVVGMLVWVRMMVDCMMVSIQITRITCCCGCSQESRIRNVAIEEHGVRSEGYGSELMVASHVGKLR